MRKLAPARVLNRDEVWISYGVYMITGSFHISLFEGTLHVDKIHVLFKIANITHALLVPVCRHTDFTLACSSSPSTFHLFPYFAPLPLSERLEQANFTPKRVVVSRLHDTVARFRIGVKFSPRYNNRGELTPK